MAAIVVSWGLLPHRWVQNMFGDLAHIVDIPDCGRIQFRDSFRQVQL
jgi:hypothetical protein